MKLKPKQQKEDEEKRREAEEKKKSYEMRSTEAQARLEDLLAR